MPSVLLNEDQRKIAYNALIEVVEFCGGVCALARKLKIQPQQVSNWKNREGRIGPTYAIRASRLTNGKVSVKMLRPDMFNK